MQSDHYSEYTQWPLSLGLKQPEQQQQSAACFYQDHFKAFFGPVLTSKVGIFFNPDIFLNLMSSALLKASNWYCFLIHFILLNLCGLLFCQVIFDYFISAFVPLSAAPFSCVFLLLLSLRLCFFYLNLCEPFWKVNRVTLIKGTWWTVVGSISHVFCKKKNKRWLKANF